LVLFGTTVEERLSAAAVELQPPRLEAVAELGGTAAGAAAAQAANPHAMVIGPASSRLIQHSSSAEQRRTDSSMWKYVKYLNVFVFCKFLKLLGNIMVLLVLGIVGFTWYAVVPGYYGPLMLVGPAGRAFGSTLLVVTFSILVSVSCSM
jgi:hypothetical protein